MIQVIGLVVCVYAMTRLLLVPIEMGDRAGAGVWVLVVLAVGMIGISGCAILLS